MISSFSKNLGPIKIKTIRESIECQLFNISDDQIFLDFSGIQKVQKNSLSFLTDSQFLEDKIYPEATYVCSNRLSKKLKGTYPLIEVEDVHKAVAVLSNIFYRSFRSDEISSFGGPKIDKSSEIAKSATIERGSIIGKNVKISDGCVIGYNCIIGDDVLVDRNTVITNSIIGEKVKIGRNVSIGQEGFGFAINKKENINIYHSGRVILQAGVKIGSNCTIDRGSFGDTIIGENSFFDNSCHVAHNVVVGNNCIFAAMSGIAGSTNIGNNVMAGGQTGIAGHLNIGNNVKIAAQSGVLTDIADNSSVMGHPAINKFTYIKKFKRNYA
ncbi:UDP-3-O-(3-hydroxymyristoyl)glucosamine N-acyltransferase [Pelagibacteraceae bacterium]|nr:UDP-3-O-(3-hydroxymyristoyl)glucosamine N-acyltransferase [Pelagibacteraceae bacterium]